MLDEIKDLMKAVLEDDELFTLSAKAMKKAYDALMAAGFTAEQATVIIANQGFGLKQG